MSLLWCANQNHKMIVKLENYLHHFGMFCLKIYKNCSLKVVLKILSLCPLSMFVHMSPTFTIAETGLENVCSNLHHRDTTKCSLPLLLVCVSLIFLMMSCDKSHVKQPLWLRIARPMCDGRPVASSLFRRLASRGPFFFCGVTLWCFFFSNCDLGKCSCLVRSSIRHYVLLFPYCPMAWSMLTLAQEPDEIDLTCFRVSSFGSLTCYVGPMSFE